MKRAVDIFLFSTLAGMALSQSASSAIKYVDATTANTALQGGIPLVLNSNYTSNSGEGAMDDLWHLRTGEGNGGNGIWTADAPDGSNEDVAPLVTTITFPTSGGYQIFAYVWDSEELGQDWDVKVRIGDLGIFSKIQASEVEPANPARFDGSIVTSESSRRLVQIPLGVATVLAGGTAKVYLDDGMAGGSRCTWYDGVGYEKVFSKLGDRIIAIDCNKTNAPAAPSQAMFRSVSGSGTQSQNPNTIFKLVGDYGMQLSKSNSAPFDFRGANGDATRSIPGGPTSRSFLVADFIGGRDGFIRIAISNLAGGTYLFRSYHLEPFNSSNLGFAQGSSPTTPNTIQARVGGSLVSIVQPTALGTSGLNTNFISETDIPTLSFPFSSDGINPVTIDLSAVYINGTDRFIFLNGFEIFFTVP